MGQYINTLNYSWPSIVHLLFHSLFMVIIEHHQFLTSITASSDHAGHTTTPLNKMYPKSNLQVRRCSRVIARGPVWLWFCWWMSCRHVCPEALNHRDRPNYPNREKDNPASSNRYCQGAQRAARRPEKMPEAECHVWNSPIKSRNGGLFLGRTPLSAVRIGEINIAYGVLR